MATNQWDSLIRFSAVEDGEVYFAALPLGAAATLGGEVAGYSNISALEQGTAPKKVSIGQLLAPVPETRLPIVCIGLNYQDHAEETERPIPTHPPMWYKPPASLANPDCDVPIPKQAYESFLDYEGELTVVTSKDAKDISPAEASEYILGYTIGNDLSARLFQLPSRSAGQFTYAKAFDKFAPMGPRLVNPKLFESEKRTLMTRVNGRQVQNGAVETIFSVHEVISFLSQGTTLPAGTAIMTGTPSGVGWFQKPQYDLKDGDVVEVEIQPIGILRNTMRYIK